MHSVKLIIVLIFTGKNLASGNSDWLVTLESYQPNWLVIKKVNLEPWLPRKRKADDVLPKMLSYVPKGDPAQKVWEPLGKQTLTQTLVCSVIPGWTVWREEYNLRTAVNNM